jgi:8-oxo-dGTP diphosphatase
VTTPGAGAEAAPERSPPRRIAAAVLLRDGLVLVQTRTEGPWAGYWEFPGGGLEPGEDEAAAAVRECREELDLQVRALAPLHAVEWSYPSSRVHVTFVLCEAQGEPRATEGQQLLWAGPAELQTLRFLPANAEVLVLLSERLAPR